MDTIKKTQARTIRNADQWRTLIARFASSGMNLKAFCSAEKVSASAFYRWRDLLSDMPIKSGASAPPAFVDCGSLATSQASSGSMQLRLDLGAGIVLTLVRH